MAKERMPFELARPDANTPVTNTSEIDHRSGDKKTPLDVITEDLLNTVKTIPVMTVVTRDGRKYLSINTLHPTIITSAMCGKAICGQAICGTN